MFSGFLFGLKAFASGAFGWVLSALSAAFKWLFSDWRNAPLVIAAAMWAAHALMINPARLRDIAERDATIAAVSLERDAERAAHARTVFNYELAAGVAERRARQNVARVEAEQSAINQEVTDDLEIRRGRARDRAERLRADARSAASDPRRAAPAGLPGTGDATPSVDAPPADPRLSATCPTARVCLTIEDALIATEQALQLNALIDWTERQAAIPFTPQEAQRAE